MSKIETLKRYIIFIIGLFVNSVGVAFITKADLGTSPISSIPYTLSLRFPLSLGTLTALFNAVLVVSQIFILKKKFPKINLLEFPVAVGFGIFIDVAMNALLFIHTDNYLIKVLYLLAGCVFLGFGVFLEVFANVIMLPGEAFVKAVSDAAHRQFALLKVLFDGSMTLCSAVLSVVFFHKLISVREGTVVAALIVALIAKFFYVHLNPLGQRIFFRKPPEIHTVRADWCEEKV